MKVNLCAVERVVRGLSGATLVVTGALFVKGACGIVLGIAGAVLILSGCTGFCHVYKVLGTGRANSRR
ncbi:MAG: DUF2892 domain-containing protein [Actinobacteria bacterium HGW-Actinobacteria-10]|jgi:uncharacterized membrane protein|nr:MAG: DUF2892 domain-containing protein [Actinobacteria bacterium HGW-Actinobacteria-10]